MHLENLIVSPCSNPEMDLDEVLSAYSSIGFRKFEVFSGWVKSSFNITRQPVFYLEKGRQHDMRFVSFHLPPITDDMEASLAEAVRAARFAKAVGADIVLFKARSRPNFIQTGKRFLDAIDGLGLTPVLQNHAGTAISSLEDFLEVIDGIGDPRMKTLLEVGHFHSVGVSWCEGYDLLRDSIALVHIKDQIGRQSVPFGTGEIDLPGIFAHMDAVGYKGDYVVEMEVKDRENTLTYLADAFQYIKKYCQQEAMP